jgi:putative NADH-flavin reductase
MHIVLFGATGMIGQRIAIESANRGHRVTAVVRNPKNLPEALVQKDITAVTGDATDAASITKVASGADAIVSAISPRPRDGRPAPSLTDAARALIEGARAAGVKRLVVVGGAGSLEVAPGQLLLDTAEFPAAWKPEAAGHRDALEVYRASGGDLDWTFISPAAVIEPGERTGQFRQGGDQLMTDRNGESRISAEDYAVAVVNTLEKNSDAKRRISVAY